jgi:tRNA pseudouridine55 synthase
VLSGILLVDKPTGPTSHGVVSATRKALGLKKVGHAGTLDPMASGLLTLGIGPGTKLLTYLVGADKRYLATIRLGQSSSTDDAEGELSEVGPAEVLEAISEEQVRSGLQAMVGEIDQVPSSVSAIKVDGKRAYDLARAGEDVALAARKVRIYSISVGEIRREKPGIDVDVDVQCSSGTYIRAIARDLGQALGVGGHLTALRRTTVGPFSVEDACEVKDIASDKLMSLANVAREVMPSVNVTATQTVELGHGKSIVLEAPAGVEKDDPVAAVDPSGRLVAIVSIESGRSRILVGFPAEGGSTSD